MNKKMKLLFGGGLVVLAVAGCAHLAGFGGGGSSQVIPFTRNSGGGTLTNLCAGVYYGMVQMTNGTEGAGAVWITPPTNITSGTLTDISGYGPPYSSVADAGCNNFRSWCGTNTVTFPASSSLKYTLTIYVKSNPPPTNGQPITLQIVWQ